LDQYSLKEWKDTILVNSMWNAASLGADNAKGALERSGEAADSCRSNAAAREFSNPDRTSGWRDAADDLNVQCDP
jgi:hypothetical protein